MSLINFTRIFLVKNKAFKFELRRKFHSNSTIVMSNKCKIGLCQVTSNNDKDSCISICKDLIIKAKENGAKVISFLKT